MQTLTRNDILSAAEYEHARPEIRRRIMMAKERRRVLVGEHCSVHFENRETMRYQVHEMLRAERSWDRPGAVEDELAAYNSVLPRRGELAATVMFEYEDPAARAARLRDLVGIDGHFWLVVGTEKPVLGEFDAMQIDDDKISSVQFVRFALDDVRRDLLKEEGTVVRLVIDHPKYQAQSVLSEQARREIASDTD